MKIETLTILAKDVKKGYVTPWGMVEVVHTCLGERVAFGIGEATVSVAASKTITITRPVADPCPRGRMTTNENQLKLDGFSIVDILNSAEIFRRIVALWNEAEQQTPYRTTAEIEEATR